MRFTLPPYVSYALKGLRKFGFKKLFSYGRNFFLIKVGSRWQLPVAAPLSIDIAVTYSCNLKCGFCDLPARGHGFKQDSLKHLLSKDEFLQLIDDAAAIGAGSVTLTGGEPLMHPDILTFIQAIQNRGMISHITTAGWFLNEKMAQQLLDAGLDGVTLSIHGTDAASHDAVVGKSGTFDRITKAARFFREARNRGQDIQVSINSVIHAENLESIPVIFNLAEVLEVHQLTFNPVHKIDSMAEPDLLRQASSADTLKKVDQVIDDLLARKKRSSLQTNSKAYFQMLKDFFRKKPFAVSCVAGHASMTIDSYGDYFACFPHFEDRKSFGNVRQTRLKDYWNGEAIKPLRANAKNCTDCYWNCQAEVNLLFDRALTPWRL